MNTPKAENMLRIRKFAIIVLILFITPIMMAMFLPFGFLFGLLEEVLTEITLGIPLWSSLHKIVKRDYQVYEKM